MRIRIANIVDDEEAYRAMIQSESFVVTSNNEILKSYRLLTSIQEIVDKFLQGQI